MAHKFDVENCSRLESKERMRLLTPSDTLKRLGYPMGVAASDVGCGIGVFTIPMAEAGGRHAQIFAVDVSQKMLDEVNRRAEMAGLGNIAFVKSEEYDFNLQDKSVDFVLICAVLHEVDDKNRFLKEAARICREGGKIAVIEFKETYTVSGPPPSHRLTRDQVSELLLDAGFHKAKDMDISEAFYAVTA